MSSRTILLAEDDKFLRRAMEVALTKRGFRVLLAADGQQALDILETERPDLILLDLLMPRKTGIEVLQELRKKPATADLLVLILSNSSKELEIHEATNLGVSGYWIKANLSLQELSERIEAVLAR
jgi:two-component system alkaline phosphatase synthesis response regulator PhoP